MNLFDYQKEVLEQTRGLNRVAYYLDMGLGKTFVGSQKMEELGQAKNLIVCQKSKVQDWMDHMKEHHDWTVYDLTKQKALDAFLTATEGVGVINYELAWRRPQLARVTAYTLLLDESSLVQNPSAKQTRFILSLRPTNTILLSGTPTSGKYENLWTQGRLLGWPISKRLYDETFINWDKLDIGGRYIRIVRKRNPYKNVDLLKKRFREHGATFMKTEEVITLPEQTFIEVKVPKRKEYDQLFKEKIVRVDGDEVVAENLLTLRIKLRQLCGQYADSKVTAFRDLLDSTEDRLVVFYNFTAELDRLLKVVGDTRPVSVVNGIRKDLTAYEDHANSVTFIQYQAGSMGLNLQKAHQVIYYSLPERSELFEQSKKRIHRVGQHHPCFYYILMCEGTIERNIYQALKQRKDFTDELFREVLEK